MSEEELTAEVFTHEGKEIHILSNGRKAVRPHHIEAYKKKISSGTKVLSHDSVPLWTLPEGLKKIFAADIKMGMDFCVAKYNASKEDIVREAKRLVPHFSSKDLK